MIDQLLRFDHSIEVFFICLLFILSYENKRKLISLYFLDQLFGDLRIKWQSKDLVYRGHYIVDACEFGTDENPVNHADL